VKSLPLIAMRTMALLALLLLPAGCKDLMVNGGVDSMLRGRADVRIPDQQRRQIQVIKINKNVSLGSNAVFRSDLPADLILGSQTRTADAPQWPLQVYAERNGIFVDRMLLDDLVAALRERNTVRVEVIDAPRGQPTRRISAPPDFPREIVVNLTIHTWGIYRRKGTAGAAAEILISFDAMDDWGNVLLKTQNYPTPQDPLLVVPLESIRENPKRIEEAWRDESKIIARQFAREF